MEPFARPTALRELNLPAPMWNPRAGATIDYYSSAAYLNGLTSLRKLTFSLTFLITVRFNDAGLDAMKGLGPTREELVIRRATINGEGLRHFTNLRALDITWSLVEDKGLESIAGMTKLREFWAKDTRMSDKTLKLLANMPDLEDVDIGGTRITGRGLAALAGLKHIRKLDILGADVDDAALDALAGMQELESLNLYRTKVSNAGLEKLKRFTKLREVDLRYTRATEAGVESLMGRAAEGETWCSSTTRLKPAGGAKEAKIVAGGGDQAVGDWVKSIGGKAVMERGALVEANLNGAPVSDDLLKNFQGLGTLRKLTLDGTEVGDLGMQHLVGLSGPRGAEPQQYGRVRRGRRVAGAVDGPARAASEQYVDRGQGAHAFEEPEEPGRFEPAGISGEGSRAGGIAGSLPALRRLSLATTDFTDEGMKHLAGLTRLERLDLASTDIGTRGSNSSRD